MAFEFGKADKPARAKKPKGFLAAASSAVDPLADVEYTDNVEIDSAAELDALAKGFRGRRDAEAKRFEQATDSEYWFAVCFRTRADKDAFLTAIKATRLGDKYIDGHALARLLDVPLS